MTTMAKNDTTKAKQETKGKNWNFPLDGVTIFAANREDAVKQLKNLQKKSDKTPKS